MLVSKLLLSVGLLFGLYAFTGSAPAQGAEPAAPVADVAGGGGDEIGSTDLVCHGQVCPQGDLCCSCKVTPTSPLQFFCGPPNACPQGTICVSH